MRSAAASRFACVVRPLWLAACGGGDSAPSLLSPPIRKRRRPRSLRRRTWPAALTGAPGSEGPDGLGAASPRRSSATSTLPPRSPARGPGGFVTGFAIAGGSVYPDSGSFPRACRGNYSFADFVSRFVARFEFASNAVYAFGSAGGNAVDRLSGAGGALRVLTRDSIVRFGAP